jgi:hypothetical protein
MVKHWQGKIEQRKAELIAAKSDVSEYELDTETHDFRVTTVASHLHRRSIRVWLCLTDSALLSVRIRRTTNLPRFVVVD